MKASCTPWDASVTVSRSGHFVALRRLRNSVSSASGKFTLNGRIGVLSLPVCCATEVMALFLLERKKRKKSVLAATVVAADGITPGRGGPRYCTAVLRPARTRRVRSLADTRIVLRGLQSP